LGGLPVEPQVGHIRAEARKGRQKQRKYDGHEYGDLAGIGSRPGPCAALKTRDFRSVRTRLTKILDYA
jgi:hypothetical protein